MTSGYHASNTYINDPDTTKITMLKVVCELILLDEKRTYKHLLKYSNSIDQA